MFACTRTLRRAERGATADEVEATVTGGERFPARFGRVGFRRNFAFGASWRGRRYPGLAAGHRAEQAQARDVAGAQARRLLVQDAEHAFALGERWVEGRGPVGHRERHAAIPGRPLSSRVDHKAIVQLSRAGNLLNQAVRYAHMTQRPADVEGAIVSSARAIEQATRALLS